MKYYSEKLHEAMMSGHRPASTNYLFDTKKELDEAEASYESELAAEKERAEREKKEQEAKEAAKTARADEISQMAKKYNEMSCEFLKDYGTSYILCTSEFKEKRKKVEGDPKNEGGNDDRPNNKRHHSALADFFEMLEDLSLENFGLR